MEKAIYLSIEEFTQIIKQILGEDVSVIVQLNDIWLEVADEPIYWEEIEAALKNYYSAKEIISICLNERPYPQNIKITYSDN